MKLITVLFLAQFSLNVFGQKDNFLIVQKIHKIVYHGDSIIYENPLILEIETSKTSKITEFTKIGNNHFGVQYEILFSELEGSGNYVIGDVYFIKTDTSNWEKIASFNYSKIKLESISARQENDSPIAVKVSNKIKEMNVTDEFIIEETKKLLEKNYKQYSSETSGDPIKFGIYYNINYYKK